MGHKKAKQFTKAGLSEGNIVNRLVIYILLVFIFLLILSPMCVAAEKEFTIKDGVSLRDYVDTRINHMEKATAIALSANDRRLDSMNEFRDTLKDQANRFATKTDYEILRADVQGLKESRAELSGKASQWSVFIAYGLSILGMAMGLVGLLKKKENK